MNVYGFDVEVPRYARLKVVDESEIRALIRGFQLEPMVDDWRPLRVEVDREDLKRPARR